MKFPEKKIAGLQIRTTNEKGQAQKDIPALWMQFEQEKIPSRIPKLLNLNIYVLYFDYEKDFTKPYSCLIGIEMHPNAEIPSGLSCQVIPAGEYTVFKAEGVLPQSLIEMWETIWQTPLKRSYKTDFEVYEPTLLSSNPPTVPIYIGVESYL